MLPARSLTGSLLRRCEAGEASAYVRLRVRARNERLEQLVRSLAWPQRSLRWMDALWSEKESAVCGFEAADAYQDSQSAQALPEWVWLPRTEGEASPWARRIAEATATPSELGLILSCKLSSPHDEPVEQLAAELLAWLAGEVAKACPDVLGVIVLLVSRCPRLPLLSLPNGLHDLMLPEAASAAEGLRLLDWAGMFALRGSVARGDVDMLALLATRRIAALDARLREEGHADGLGGGDFSYAEVCSRGKQRWDMLLHAPQSGEALHREASVPELIFGPAAGALPEDAKELERIARGGAWIPTVKAALGEDYEWQVSLIVSRKGAPAGHWHSDGGHSRFTYGEEGESAPLAYALCAFVPLVPLAPPILTSLARMNNGGDGGAREFCGGVHSDFAAVGDSEMASERSLDSHWPRVYHGSGCTVFWPGSHRQPACLQLGCAASTRLDAVICGAPLDVGDALVYDYRTVHCGSPNEGSERPIVQFTFTRRGYRDRFRNYGFHQLFYDDDVTWQKC